MSLPFRNPIVSALLALAACAPPSSQSPGQAEMPQPLPIDPHSFARPAEARVTHVSLDLTPDFTTRRITGTARLAIRLAVGEDSIMLDARDLTIRRITNARGNALGYSLGAAQKILGSRLAIALPPGAGTDTIVIDYQTSPDAAAVQWLSAEQTAGRRLPFLFTQGQAILTAPGIAAESQINKTVRVVSTVEYFLKD